MKKDYLYLLTYRNGDFEIVIGTGVRIVRFLGLQFNLEKVMVGETTYRYCNKRRLIEIGKL